MAEGTLGFQKSQLVTSISLFIVTVLVLFLPPLESELGLSSAL